VRWILDPIDGTVNFLYAIPQYAVSIAAEVDGVVVAGVVVNVATGREYSAALGHGARGDDVPLGVRAPAPLGQRLIGTGFSYDPHQRSIQGEAVARLLPEIRDIRRQGSCALDLCHVAEGLLDGYVEEGVNVWDHAAAGLIARESGARTEVTLGAGGRDAMICAPAHGFSEFRAAVEAAGFLTGFRE
jgi:myo-inositol-1(or 4)-monophosphatase